MVTIRLDPKLEDRIQRAAGLLDITKSELVRQSIVAYLDGLSHQSPWELGRDHFGKYASGQNNLSTDRKLLVKEKIRAKRE